MNNLRLKCVLVLATVFTVAAESALSANCLSNQSAKFFMSMARETAPGSADMGF